MKKVDDILKRKGKNVITVEPSLSVLDALNVMASSNIGSVVVAENGAFKGIMTERDYSRKVVLKGRNSTETTVGEIMGTDFPKVSSNDSVDYCMALMSDKNIRYLPVMNNDDLLGIVSINDLVKETILSQQETIAHLKDYLHS